jgi:hypothetical protein
MWRAAWAPKELNGKLPLPRHLHAMRAHCRHVTRLPDIGPLRSAKSRGCLMSLLALSGTDWQVFSALSDELTAAVKRPAALSAALPSLLRILSSPGKWRST